MSHSSCNTLQNSQATAGSTRQFLRLLTYVRAYKTTFVIAILGMLTYASIDIYFFAQIETFIDKGLGQKDYDLLFTMGLAIPVVFLARGVANFTSTFALAWVGNQVVATIRQQLFRHYINLPVSFHDKHSTGDLISKITYDTEQVNNTSSKALTILIKEGAFVIGLLAYVFYLSWQLSLIFLVLGPIVAVIVAYVSKRFREVSKRIQAALGGVTSVSEQMLNSHKVVISHGGQKIEDDKFFDINNLNRQQQLKLISTRVASVAVIQILASFALAAVFIIASEPTFLNELSTGTFTTVLTMMMMLLRPLKMLTTVNSEFQKGMAACASIFSILDIKAEQDQGKDVLCDVKGELSLDNVVFSYEGQENPALDGVSLKIKAGTSLALVGKSGSGKSTVSHLLCRFYDNQQGSIKLDGKDIQQITLASLRQHIAMVSQDVSLFNDTIANNIAYGCAKSVSRNEIEAAAKAAHVLEFSDNMARGLDSEIGENGVSLSGGQRQRIAIARAILRDAPILILDEATSALDTESERHIQQALDRLQKGRTVIIIAHRLSTIESADNIAVISKGKVIEQGPHQSLINQRGAYKELYDLQFGENDTKTRGVKADK